jgi:hypothetical protein
MHSTRRAKAMPAAGNRAMTVQKKAPDHCWIGLPIHLGESLVRAARDAARQSVRQKNRSMSKLIEHFFVGLNASG